MLIKSDHLIFINFTRRFSCSGSQSINQSTRIYIAPYVAGESETRTGLG